jgi:hypothetical protein
VIAEARVISRGRSITIVEVDGRATDGRPVVRALVTYKLSGEERESLDRKKARLAALRAEIEREESAS